MLTETDIANRALAYNDLDPIMTITENSDRAKKIRPVWKNVFETFLQEHEWSFAKKIDKPGRLKLQTEDPIPYAYAFAQPEDMIKLQAVYSVCPGKQSGAVIRNPVAYETARFGDSRKPAIFTDVEAIVIEYTSNKTLIDDFSAKAQEALALKLAIEISLNYKNSSQRTDVLIQRYKVALSAAMTTDAKSHTLNRLGGRQYNAARIIWR